MGLHHRIGMHMNFNCDVTVRGCGVFGDRRQGRKEKYFPYHTATGIVLNHYCTSFTNAPLLPENLYTRCISRRRSRKYLALRHWRGQTFERFWRASHTALATQEERSSSSTMTEGRK
jgi:hypothetical protein